MRKVRINPGLLQHLVVTSTRESESRPSLRKLDYAVYTTAQLTETLAKEHLCNLQGEQSKGLIRPALSATRTG